jgi:hypothetical protein
LRGNPMLAHPTLDQLNALGLYGLAKGLGIPIGSRPPIPI